MQLGLTLSPVSCSCQRRVVRALVRGPLCTAVALSLRAQLAIA